MSKVSCVHYWLSRWSVPVGVTAVCAALLMVHVIVQGLSAPLLTVAFSFESISLVGLFYLLFGLFALFGGLALFVISFACRRMGIGEYRGLKWFASFSLIGGIWCFADPLFVFPFLPYPQLIYTLSAICQHGLVVGLVGYLRTCISPRGAFLGSLFLWAEMVLMIGGTISQLSNGPSLFDLGIPSSIFQLSVFSGLLLLFSIDSFRHRDSIRDASGLLALLPCIIGLVVDTLLSFTGISVDGPWFGIGFCITVCAQIGVFLRYIQIQSEQAARAHLLERELIQNKTAIILSQIQPHFLFNALNTIQCLCETQPRVAAEAVTRFAHYMRGNLDSLSQRAPVSIKQDVQHLKDYLAIEQLRFPDINVQFSLSDTDFDVPTLTLQPLVENAIRHGLTTREKGGTVTISTWEEQQFHCLSVADNGVGYDTLVEANDGRSHVGLKNTANRLKWLCDATLSIESVIDEGTTILVRIPKEKAQNKYHSAYDLVYRSKAGIS